MFQKNIEAIKLKNPNLAGKLEKINIESITDIVVGEAETKDLIIGYKDWALHSTIDPIREANALWNKAIKSELKKNDIQIIFGLGLGYLFKRAFVNAESKIILVEPVLEVLRFVLEHVDFSVELADTRVYITDSIEDVVEKLSEEYIQGDKAEFLFLPAYTQFAQDYMAELTNRVVKILEEKSSDADSIFKLALPWSLNFIKNLPYLYEYRPLGFFRDIFAGKAALVIAAGPGLKDNIETIKQNKDKYATIATGKAFKELAQNGFVPDFVTYVNGLDLETQINGVEAELENTNLILSSKTDSIAPKLKSKAKILYLSEADPFSRLFSKHSDNNPGSYGAATCEAIISYYIVKSLGFGDVAFVGLDLENDDNSVKVKRQFEEILEKEISLSKVVNTSLKGLHIKGMDYVDLDKFLAGCPEQDLNIDKALSVVFEETEKTWSNCVKNVSKEVFDTYQDVKEINEEAASILNNNIENMIIEIENCTDQSVDMDKVNELIAKLNNLRTRVMNNLLMQGSAQGELWAYTKDYHTENMFSKDIMLNNLEVEKKLLTGFEDHSRQIYKSMEEAQQNLKQLNRI